MDWDPEILTLHEKWMLVAPAKCVQSAYAPPVLPAGRTARRLPHMLPSLRRAAPAKRSKNRKKLKPLPVVTLEQFRKNPVLQSGP